MKIFNIKVIASLFIAAFIPVMVANAQQDAATAARQAEIDADQAGAKIEEIDKDALDSAKVDGIDAPELTVDEAAIDAEKQKFRNAERREAQAEDAEYGHTRD